MAKDPDSGSMSEESISLLEEVKKGKPRKFAMICKGTSVVSLVVYKKGNVEKRKKEAKESGKGQFYHGVVDGKGINIRFVLARADGFEDAPVKTSVLKSFLEESADFKCKPVFEIVDSAPDVLDEDDPLVARFLALKKSAEMASQTHPDRAGELSSLCETIRQHLLQEQTEQATASVQTLEKLLSQLGNAAGSNAGSNAGPNAGAPAADAPNAELEDEIPPPPPPPPSESTPQPSRTDEALRLKLQEALNKFIPQLKELVAASPERKTELLSPVAAAKKQLDAGELIAAKQSILAIGTMLKSLVANQPQAGQDPSAGNAPPSALQLEYQSKLQELTPKYEQALREQLGDTGKFRAVMSYVTEQAEAGGYANAIKALDRLTQAIAQAFAAGVKETDVIRQGLVAEQVERLDAYFRMRIDEAVRKSEAEIANLEIGIEDVPDEDPAALTAALTEEINVLYDSAARELYAALNEQDPDKVLQVIQAWRDRVAGDPIVAHLQEAQASLGVQANVLEIFEALFFDIESELEYQRELEF